MKRLNATPSSGKDTRNYSERRQEEKSPNRRRIDHQNRTAEATDPAENIYSDEFTTQRWFHIIVHLRPRLNVIGEGRTCRRRKRHNSHLVKRQEQDVRTTLVNVKFHISVYFFPFLYANVIFRLHETNEKSYVTNVRQNATRFGWWWGLHLFGQNFLNDWLRQVSNYDLLSLFYNNFCGFWLAQRSVHRITAANALNVVFGVMYWALFEATKPSLFLYNGELCIKKTKKITVFAFYTGLI